MELDLKIVFAGIASILVIISVIPYLKDMFGRKTKPHTYTWLIWSLTQGTAVAGILHGGGGWGALSLSIGTGSVFLIFLLSFKYGTRNIKRGDTIILVGALLAILVWWQLDNPLLAIFMISAIDFLGYLPTFRKTIEEPWSETISTYIIFSIATLFSFLALSEYNFLTLTYSLTIISANTILTGIVFTRRKVVPKTQ